MLFSVLHLGAGLKAYLGRFIKGEKMGTSKKMSKCKCGVTFIRTDDARCPHCVSVAKKNKALNRLIREGN